MDPTKPPYAAGKHAITSKTTLICLCVVIQLRSVTVYVLTVQRNKLKIKTIYLIQSEAIT